MHLRISMGRSKSILVQIATKLATINLVNVEIDFDHEEVQTDS